jgi:hypothetical protein
MPPRRHRSRYTSAPVSLPPIVRLWLLRLLLPHHQCLASPIRPCHAHA